MFVGKMISLTEWFTQCSSRLDRKEFDYDKKRKKNYFIRKIKGKMSLVEEPYYRLKISFVTGAQNSGCIVIYIAVWH